MKVIVPIDFTEGSFHAAEFALKMLSNTPVSTIILYHVYEEAAEAKLVNESLQELKERFPFRKNVFIKCKAEKGEQVIPTLARFAKREGADLIVMVVNRHEKFIVGNHSVQMIEEHVCPVLVIPPHLENASVKNIAVACDFTDVLKTIPVVPVKKLLDIFQPELHIVNINSKNIDCASEEYQTEKKTLENLFAAYQPKFHCINTENFHQTLRRFVVNKGIDLVLTFPRKHAFINNRIKGNPTRKIVFEADVPVLATPE